MNTDLNVATTAEEVDRAARAAHEAYLVSAAQTPATCQSRSRRQQLIPDPQPISAGSISQGRPDFSTNKMPVSAARSESRGRPPFGFGRSRGSSGSIAAQRSSGTRGFAMPGVTLSSRFC